MGNRADRGVDDVEEEETRIPEESEESPSAAFGLQAADAIRSVVDKFLINALLDPKIRSIYEKVPHVRNLKRRQIEVLLGAARQGQGQEDSAATTMTAATTTAAGQATTRKRRTGHASSMWGSGRKQESVMCFAVCHACFVTCAR